MLTHCSVLDVRSGHLQRDLSPDAIAQVRREPGQVIWVDIQDPDEADFAVLEKEFAFHPLALEDCSHAHQRPKLDRYDGYVFMVLYEARIDAETGSVVNQEINLFLGSNYVVTVHAGPSLVIPALQAHWTIDPGLEDEGASYLAYTIMDGVVDGYFPMLDQFSDRLDAVESRIFDQFDERIISAIFELKKEILALRRLVTPLRDVFLLLLRGPGSGFGERTYVYFQDVLDHLLRISDGVDVQRDLVGSALDAYQTAVSNRTNDTMKKLTVLSTILMTMALITGIYGMNFAFIPELAWPFGYHGALYMMASSSLFLTALFYWKRYIGYDPTQTPNPKDVLALLSRLKPAKRLSSTGTFMVLALIGIPVVLAPFLIAGHLPPIVTKAGFDHLRPGMTLNKVTQVIGAVGKETSAEDDGKVRRQVYAWTNPDGSLVSATFENGKLITRRYERLK